MLTVTSLFSGIGGIDLGLEQTGYFKTTLFSEIDPYCQKILRQHWPNVTIIPDVKDIDGKKIKSDVIVGGFPCQPFSVAGKRKGKDDKRHLWPEMFRIIKDAKPSIVIGENVPGIINVQMALGSCISDLESEGYNVQCFVLPASAVGAPHRRYRVFIIAMANTDHRNHNEKKEIQARWNTIDTSSTDVENTRRTLRQRGKLSEKNEDEVGKENADQHQRSSSTPKSDVANTNERNVETGCKRQRGVRKKNTKKRSASDASSSSKTLANTKLERLQRGQRNDKREGWKILSSEQHDRREIRSEIRRSSGISGQEERSQGWWSVEPSVGRVAHGVPNRVDRTKALGNAVIPQLAYAIGISIIKSIKGE
jgi:DNA (cytosine-5)-methyltransferase 1